MSATTRALRTQPRSARAARRRSAALRATPSARTTRASSASCSSTSETGSPNTTPAKIDAFDLDDLIHRYKRSAQKLWSFCTGSSEHVARMLDWMREQGDETDWWKAGEPRRR
jgi:hypothetical protein